MTAPANIQIPTKPSERGASTTISQRDRRWTDTFFDDHKHPLKFPNGRPFTGEREFKSGVSEQSVNAGFLQSDLQCGEYFCENPAMGQTPIERQMTLESAWTAPFFLPGGKKYMEFNYARKRIRWRYDAFINDERAGMTRYWEAAAKLAGESDVIDPAHPNKVPFRIRTLLGSPFVYMNRIRLAQACQAGDPWILGMVDTPNEELVKLVGFQPVQYLGGDQLGDSAFVTVPTPKAPEPVVTPEQVLSVPMDMVQKMIADALAQRDEAEKRRRKEIGERLKKGREKAQAKKTSETVGG